MAEPLAKTGRGGAGNYWSKKDLEEAAKAGPDEVLYHKQKLKRNQDLEAQRTGPALTRTTTGHLTLTDYSKIGRGGAGNVVYTPKSTASTSELERITTVRAVTNAVGSVKKETGLGHGGRGGAGNWRGSLEKRKWEEEEERVRQEMERRVNEEVGMRLKLPGAAYRGHGSPRG